MNKVMLVGRLVRDPDMKVVGDGLTVARITIAVNRRFKKDEADFIPVTFFRQPAEFIGKYIKKGDLVSVEGSYKTGSYEKDGATVYTTEVAGDNISGLGGKSDGSKPAKVEEKKVEKPKLNASWEIDL